MPFQFSRARIPDVVLIQPRMYPDGRGFFMESYKHSEFAAHGICETFVQSNHSFSWQGRSPWASLSKSSQGARKTHPCYRWRYF